MIKKCLFAVIAFIAIFIAGSVIYPPQISEAAEKTVHHIALNGEITPAMSSFIIDKIDEANKAKADGIILDITTLGGRVDSAVEIKDAILQSKIPIAAFVRSRAQSAGALITIAADTIIMAPGSHMGSAEPIPYSDKNVAYVSGEFKTAAEERGRDTTIASAMVDKRIEIPGITREGELLDLTANEALDCGYADAVIADINEVVTLIGLPSDTYILKVEPDFKIRIAQFLTSSHISSILLIIGMLALVIEFFTPGFGVAGSIGILSFLLYFSGGVLAGNTEWWAVILFVIGILFIIIELFVPGFGFFGISGIIAMIAGIIFAAPNPLQGFTGIGLAFIITLIAAPFIIKAFGKGSGIFGRLVLSEAETPQSGYVSSTEDTSLIGRTGFAVTPLRPSGTIEIGNIRLDAVSDGGYIPKATGIRIINVEGSRIIVTIHKDLHKD